MNKVFRLSIGVVTAVLLFLTTDCKKEKFTSLPVVGTISMTSVSDTYAESKSKINADGGATVTVRGVCWNLTSAPTTADSKTTDDKPGTGTFMSKITGLTPGTTYHLRTFATNEVGTSYSDEITFSTKSTLPTLTTTAIAAIAATTATSGGNITNDGGAAVIARGVCWGTTTNPTTSNLKTTDGTGTGIFTSNITGLSAGTVYHIRAYATNTLGTSYGSDITFSTSAVLPSLTTSPVTAITSATVGSGGNITSDGGAAITARGVCWSTTANAVTTDSKTIDGTGTGQFVSSITGLTAGATYHLRAYATNSAGTAYGADIPFVTLGQTPSGVSQQATNLSISGATLNGVVNPNYLSTTVTFEYGLTTAYGQTIAAEQSPVTGNSLTNVSANISGLTQGTTYHFRVKTVNSLGTVYSGDMSFVTLNFATLNTIIISSLTSNTAASGGNIITDGGAPVSARGVCWNTTGNPTVADNKTADGSGTGSFVSQITSLLPATTYFVRSYATSSEGTSYGNEISFVTLAAQSYPNGNEAYWTESVNGFRPVMIGNGNLVYEYNASTKQYLSGNLVLIPNLNGNPDGEVVDRTNFYGFSGGSGDNSKFQWDGQKNSAVPVTVFDMINLFVSPISASTMTYAEALNVGSTMACTNSSNSMVIIDGPSVTLLYPDKTPTTGTFNLWNGADLVYGGNLKNSTSTFVNTKDEYFSQQQLALTVNKSYCVATYGQGWRLPTDLEIGHKVNTYDYTLQTTLDPGYQGTSGQIFTSSRFLYPGYAFYKWYTVISNGIWNNIDQWSKTKYQVRCVYSGR